MTELPSVRVGAAERERALRELAQHFGAGRLALSEFDRRAALAAAADTRAELGRLFADLPAPQAPEPAPHPPANPLPAVATGVVVLILLAVVLASVSSAYWLLLVLFVLPLVAVPVARLRRRDDPPLG
ncbi:DUF1707 SHOCT-like domain-containing protein [Nocardia sp. alder85J]|uniref:DUF1707 SHOCT-like domain-containing protein n=1 Tax=Nocardia sp. alder85J TaxID=2862949 RepID=UPI001CD4D263|nr:DUF1707 domain-containing protein [Nocardia sp. alder85J]MCX4092210.1 DUF1707 domain-containing protein [Nocardia sp. alder85J]